MNGKGSVADTISKFNVKISEGRKKTTDKCYIGFGNLPNQLYHKISKTGTTLNLLIIGDSGSGSSTLINTLFNAHIISKKASICAFSENVTIHTTEAVLKEEGFPLKLRVLRVSGFGSLMNNSSSWKSIVKCINDRFEQYFQAESSLDRPPMIDDCRIHCCIYLLAGRPRRIDVLAIKAIGDCVALIPVLGKADTYTPAELVSVKTHVLSTLSDEGARLYDFSHSLAHVCEDTKQLLNELMMRVPFSVMGSEDWYEGVRGRKYNWGLAEVENLEHSDTHALRYLLLCVGLPGLLRYTDEVTYRFFREAKLGEELVTSPISQLEHERATMDIRLKEAERSMEEMFQMKVSQKMAKLEDTQTSYEEKARTFKEEVATRREQLDAMREAFEKDRNHFVANNPSFLSFRSKKEKKKSSTVKVPAHI